MTRRFGFSFPPQSHYCPMCTTPVGCWNTHTNAITCRQPVAALPAHGTSAVYLRAIILALVLAGACVAGMLAAQLYKALV